MTATAPAAASKFVPLGGSTSLYTPEEPTKGCLIIMATWLGASKKHLTKYTTAYTKIAQGSRILLIEGAMGSLFQPYSTQERLIQPAVETVQAVLDECGYRKENLHPETPPHILLHAFSNGGASSVANLLHVFHRNSKIPIPLVGIICDSAVAEGGYRQNYRGFMRALPDVFLLKVVGPVFINFALFLLNASIAVGRYERPEDYWRKSIIDEELLRVGDGDEGGKKICYFASKIDQTTPWEDVVSHSEMARENGWNVTLFMYEDTPHCNHMAKHGEEYQGTMKAFWTKSKL